MNNKDHWNDFYKKPISDIPWEISEPPAELKELIKKGVIKPGKALDIACGSGNYSIYLAGKGFEVTGIDFSKSAIKIAKSKNSEIDFLVGNVLEMDRFIPEAYFDFILDYSLLHHISPVDIKTYAGQVARALKPGGKLLLVCYSEQHKRAKGNDKAIGKHGNTMFFRTKQEISDLYAQFRLVNYKPARLGKEGRHPAHCFLLEKH